MRTANLHMPKANAIIGCITIIITSTIRNIPDRRNGIQQIRTVVISPIDAKVSIGASPDMD